MSDHLGGDPVSLRDVATDTDQQLRVFGFGRLGEGAVEGDGAQVVEAPGTVRRVCDRVFPLAAFDRRPFSRRNILRWALYHVGNSS